MHKIRLNKSRDAERNNSVLSRTPVASATSLATCFKVDGSEFRVQSAEAIRKDHERVSNVRSCREDMVPLIF